MDEVLFFLPFMLFLFFALWVGGFLGQKTCNWEKDGNYHVKSEGWWMYLFGLHPQKEAFYLRPGFFQLVAFVYLIGGTWATFYYGRRGFAIFTAYVYMGGIISSAIVGFVISLNQKRK